MSFPENLQHSEPSKPESDFGGCDVLPGSNNTYISLGGEGALIVDGNKDQGEYITVEVWKFINNEKHFLRWRAHYNEAEHTNYYMPGMLETSPNKDNSTWIEDALFDLQLRDPRKKGTGAILEGGTHLLKEPEPDPYEHIHQQGWKSERYTIADSQAVDYQLSLEWKIACKIITFKKRNQQGDFIFLAKATENQTIKAVRVGDEAALGPVRELDVSNAEALGATALEAEKNLLQEIDKIMRVGGMLSYDLHEVRA